MAALADGASYPSPLLKRALAVYTIPDRRARRRQITLLAKVLGEGTRRLASAKPGDNLSLVGPLGNGFDLDRSRNRINLIVVGGTGIASVYLLTEDIALSGEEVHLIYGGRTANDLVGLADFERLGVPILTTTEDGSKGLKGLVTDGLKECLNQFPARHLNVYTCGPSRMMESVTRLTRIHGIACQISVEVKMACGFGVCLGCTVKVLDQYRLACTHGPVFDGTEFVWEGSKLEELIG